MDDIVIMEGMVSFRSVVYGIEAGISDRKIEKVLFDESKKRDLSRHLSYIKAKSYQHSFPVEFCDRDKIDSLSSGQTHGGILTFCSQRTIKSIEYDNVTDGVWFLLDGIEDPFNFGYSLRSLYASGVQGVIISKRNWMSASATVCKSSAGASEQMPMYIYEDAASLVEIFKSHLFKVFCADLEDSVSMWEADLHAPLLMIIGGEKRGISKELRNLCDGVVKIDYARQFGASLSAASAATVLAYEIARQNKEK